MPGQPRVPPHAGPAPVVGRGRFAECGAERQDGRRPRSALAFFQNLDQLTAGGPGDFNAALRSRGNRFLEKALAAVPLARVTAVMDCSDEARDFDLVVVGMT